jgi:hypothetical protein
MLNTNKFLLRNTLTVELSYSLLKISELQTLRKLDLFSFLQNSLFDPFILRWLSIGAKVLKNLFKSED